MIFREFDNTEAVNWGNGTSTRLLTEMDNMGFTVCHTIVSKGTESRLQYRRHLEACYCIKGAGQVISADGETTLNLKAGALYALDKNDAHRLIASKDEDLHLVSVFNPPLTGKEKHSIDSSSYSQY